MKNAPNSKSNLDRALQRFAGDYVRANGLRGQMANAIVAKAFWHRKLSFYDFCAVYVSKTVCSILA